MVTLHGAYKHPSFSPLSKGKTFFEIQGRRRLIFFPQPECCNY